MIEVAPLYWPVKDVDAPTDEEPRDHSVSASSVLSISSSTRLRAASTSRTSSREFSSVYVSESESLEVGEGETMILRIWRGEDSSLPVLEPMGVPGRCP